MNQESMNNRLYNIRSHHLVDDIYVELTDLGWELIEGYYNNCNIKDCKVSDLIDLHKSDTKLYDFGYRDNVPLTKFTMNYFFKHFGQYCDIYGSRFIVDGKIYFGKKN